jgi:predicted DCC family thiol-disulfide oxidoreductase YuxK
MDEELKNKLIVYDSNCKVCTTMKGILVSVAPFIAGQVIAYKDLANDHSNKIDLQRFRNEMAVIDKGERMTRYGAEGIAFIFSSRYKTLKVLFSSGVFISVFTFLYKTIATNRYIIALPKSRFKCDCYPDRITKYRLSYIVITIMISLFLTSLFGVSLQFFFPQLSTGKAIVEALLIAGSGWVLQILLVIIILRERALDYIGHLGSIMVTGLIVLIPSILLRLIFAANIVWIPALSVAVSSTLMLFLHINRIRWLGLHSIWTYTWFIFLQSTALFWIYIFHIKQ